jgi:hypothetical protein
LRGFLKRVKDYKKQTAARKYKVFLKIKTAVGVPKPNKFSSAKLNTPTAETNISPDDKCVNGLYEAPYSPCLTAHGAFLQTLISPTGRIKRANE